jgi:AAT family amino acid transporter/D-serine/D-alanine/glycine transporter
MSQVEAPHLARRLQNRHIQLIALGGTIGTGLFLGSAQRIHEAGPGLILAYILCGVAVFFMMRALGELLTYRPVAGSFASYADEFCGPLAGFITGWSYWFMWVVTAMAELTAIGKYVAEWLPNLPQWVPALVALVTLYGTNLLAVRVFGEMEFWFALIKVLTIVLLILAGLGVLFTHVGPLGHTAGFSNLWSHGGLLPAGFQQVLLSLQMVVFAYQGVELIGVTAGEAKDPEVALPKATNGIVYRILIFYIGALVILMALVPWNELSPDRSPFVAVFDKIGLPAAANIINLVVITAAASACNSGIFSTGRMLHNLAAKGQGPAAFARINDNQVPATGIHASAALMLIAVVLNYFFPTSQVFVWVTSVATIGTLWTWGIIMVAHRNYRRAVDAGKIKASSFRMPGAPIANWLVLAFLVGVIPTFWFNKDNQVALFVAPIWFGLLVISYLVTRSKAAPAAQSVRAE